MNTSVGDPPWLVVGEPMPIPGNTVTASTATTVTTTATAAEVLGAEGLPRLPPLPRIGPRSNRASAGSPGSDLFSGRSPVGRMGLVRVKDSRSAGAAEAAAWGGRNEESLRSFHQTLGLRCSASNGWASAPPLPDSSAALPDFLESDHGSPRIDSADSKLLISAAGMPSDPEHIRKSAGGGERPASTPRHAWAA